jgi:hypothetical protein
MKYPTKPRIYKNKNGWAWDFFYKEGKYEYVLDWGDEYKTKATCVSVAMRMWRKAGGQGER